MAIPYGAKLFETTTLTRDPKMALGSAVKEGALIIYAYAGQRSSGFLNISAVSDTAGNTWSTRTFQSEYRACGLAWTRASRAMTTSDRITLEYNGTPSYSWRSCHTFEGASAAATDTDSNTASGTNVSVTLAVTGSDWLTFAVAMLPYADGPTLTPVNSSVSRDTNGRTTRPWAECWSRNGTTGSTHTIGATSPSSVTMAVVAVSFPFEAMPGGANWVNPPMVGI